MSNLQTPEERLCSRSWRIQNSAWLLWSILSAGMFTCVGFLIHAIAMKSKKMYLFAGAWALTAVIYIVLTNFIETGTKTNPVDTPEANMLNGYIALVYFGGIIHSVLSNRAWLRWKAHHSGNGSPWYAGSTSDAVSSNSTKPAKSSDQAINALKSNGVGDANESNLAIDVNSATADELISQGFDAASASKIINEKVKSGPFQNQEDLLQRSGVAPHVVLGAGSQLSYEETLGSQASASSDNNKDSPTSRRKLDF